LPRSGGGWRGIHRSMGAARTSLRIRRSEARLRTARRTAIAYRNRNRKGRSRPDDPATLRQRHRRATSRRR
jgi:hypothetical protein